MKSFKQYMSEQENKPADNIQIGIGLKPNIKSDEDLKKLAKPVADKLPKKIFGTRTLNPNDWHSGLKT